MTGNLCFIDIRVIFCAHVSSILPAVQTMQPLCLVVTILPLLPVLSQDAIDSLASTVCKYFHSKTRVGSMYGVLLMLLFFRPFPFPFPSTSFTTAAYGSHQNVFIRLDPLGRPPSANSGSYATIASLNKYPISESKKSCKCHSWGANFPPPLPPLFSIDVRSTRSQF